EFFAFILRDTGSRAEQRKHQKSFTELRNKQREEDVKRSSDGKVEGRYFKEFPDQLLFLMRTLGLVRGLSTTLGASVWYMETMADHARLGLLLEVHSKLSSRQTSALVLNPDRPLSLGMGYGAPSASISTSASASVSASTSTSAAVRALLQSKVDNGALAG